MKTAELREAGAACAHCGLPVPPAMRRVHGEPSFCCRGCEHVHGVLQAAGLESYYVLRDEFEQDGDARPASESTETYAAFEREAFRTRHVRSLDDRLERVEFLLEGVRCAACVWLIESLPRVEPGVRAARVGLADAQVRVDYDPAATSPGRIARALSSLGYTPHVVRREERVRAARAEERRRLLRLAVAGACAGNVMLVSFALYSGRAGGLDPNHAALFRWTALVLGLSSLAWPGSEFFRGAWAALRTRTGSLDVPIALALGVGAVAGIWQTVSGDRETYFDSLSVLVFLLLVGRWVQFRQQSWARRSVDLARAFTPGSARRVEPGGDLQEVGAQELRPEDLVEVRTGEVLPADGSLTSDRARLDRSLLTGESEPVTCTSGEPLHAGTRNLGGTLRMRVTRVGPESRVGKLLELVERGLGAKPRIQRLTDRISWAFVSAVCLLGSVTFGLWWMHADLATGIDNAVALLIVACPCALGLATPLTLAVASGLAAKRGLLVQNAAVFEDLARGGRLVLDKTGTLTAGRPTVKSWHGDESLQGDVAALERGSTHPVARALVRAFDAERSASASPRDVQERQDGGVSGELRGRSLRVGTLEHLARYGCTVQHEHAEAARSARLRGESAVVVAVDGRSEAVCGLGDVLREDALPAVRALEELGFEPEICSGDASETVARCAVELGLDPRNARGGVSPEDKQARVRELQARGLHTVMVGDGVNDAAGLSAAHVGISVHGSAEASLLAADVHASRPGLLPLVELVQLAHRTRRTILTNLAVSLTYNTLAVGLAMAGRVDPLVAAVLMPISSASVLAFAMFSLRGSSVAGGAPRPLLARGSDRPSFAPAPEASRCP